MLKLLIMNEIQFVRKNIVSHIFTLLFPVIMYSVLVPELIKVSGSEIDLNTAVLFIVLFIQLPAAFYGKDLSTNLLADKDNNILKSLKISPMGINTYIKVKIALFYIYSFISTYLLIAIINKISIDIYPTNFISVKDSILLSILIAFITPVVGLLIFLISKNKVDGNGISALGIIVILLPVVLLQPMFKEEIQYIFSLAPNFGVSKYLLIEFIGYTTLVDFEIINYIIIAVVTNLVYIFSLYKLNIIKIYKN